SVRGTRGVGPPAAAVLPLSLGAVGGAGTEAPEPVFAGMVEPKPPKPPPAGAPRLAAAASPRGRQEARVRPEAGLAPPPPPRPRSGFALHGGHLRGRVAERGRARLEAAAPPPAGAAAEDVAQVAAVDGQEGAGLRLRVLGVLVHEHEADVPADLFE